jgi:hypothetical protein
LAIFLASDFFGPDALPAVFFAADFPAVAFLAACFVGAFAAFFALAMDPNFVVAGARCGSQTGRL